MSAQPEASNHSASSQFPSPPDKNRKLSDHHAEWRRETSSTYLSKTEVENNVWDQFYKNWWGPTSPGNAVIKAALSSEDPADRIIQVAQPRIWQFLSLLHESRGKILIRADYDILYDKVHKGSTSNRKRGAHILGQPGIGKSYFAVYLLLRRMADGLPVLFSTSYRTTYLFDELGVWSTDKNTLRDWHLPHWDYEETASRVWSIIVPTMDVSAEVSPATSSSLFCIFATSPQRIRYRAWCKKYTVDQWVANPWPSRELHVLLSDDEMTRVPSESRAPYQTLAKVEELVDAVGPCPRDIIAHLYRPDFLDEEIDDALIQVQSIEDLIAMFRRAPRDADPNLDADTLILLRREEGRGRDIGTVQFKTRHIALRTLAKFHILSLADARDFFHAAGASRADHWFAGWTF